MNKETVGVQSSVKEPVKSLAASLVGDDEGGTPTPPQIRYLLLESDGYLLFQDGGQVILESLT